MFRESGHISERLVEVKKGLFGTFISGLILTGYSLNTDHANIDEAEVEVWPVKSSTDALRTSWIY